MFARKRHKKSGQPTFAIVPIIFCLKLIVEDIFQSLDIHVAIKLREISRKLNGLRTNFNAVLTVAATGNAALFHERIQTFGSVEFPKRMQVEQISLNRRRRSDEV